MIEDEELKNIFSIESAEHIQHLEEDFIRLEKEPDNTAVLDEAFREAHSLKGAARMLGLAGIETLSHRIEDVLGTARRSSGILSPEVISGLYKDLDALGPLVKEAVGAVASGVGTEVVESPEPLIKVPPPAPAPPAETEDFRIDTIRVETHRLDKLMSQAGELNVTRLRIVRRLEEINEVLAFWDNLSVMLPQSALTDPAIPERFGRMLKTLRNGIYEDSSRLDLITSGLNENIGRVRLLPMSMIFNLFQRMVKDLAKDKAKEVRLVIEGGETPADKRIIEEMKDPIMHMVRNSIDHGIELPDERMRKKKPPFGTITLKAFQTPAHLVLEVRDDGKGLDLEAIKHAALKIKKVRANELSAMTPAGIQSLILASGVSTSSFVSDISGRGVGLDVVRAKVERLKGTIRIESSPDTGCTFEIRFPLTLATSKVMIVKVGARKYAVPVEHIQTTSLINRKNIFTIEGRRSIVFDKLPVTVADLSDLLELRDAEPVSRSSVSDTKILPCIILSAGDDKLGLFVNELLDEQDVVLKQYSGILKRTRNISGATILGTGEVCMVLNPFDLIKSAKKEEPTIMHENTAEEVKSRKSILVAEDSITVRTQLKRILEGAGYEVAVAVDGLSAFELIGVRPFDALVSDIQMPNMSGLELTEKIRKIKKYGSSGNLVESGPKI